MAVFEAEDKVRQKRAKTEQALAAAAKGRWEEAERLNREIVDLAPGDVDAHNRLGKALMELGRYSEARKAYSGSLKLDSMNSIAQKNLQRLQNLTDNGVEPSGGAPSAVDPRLFIEESGKTTVTGLTDVPRGEWIARLAAGDPLRLEVEGKRIIVLEAGGQQVGRVEPKLEQTLLKLLQMGNQYAVFVTSVNEQGVTVIVRETHRSAAMGSRPSFRPSAVPEGGFRSYTREGVLRYELEDEDEDAEEAEEGEEGEVEADVEAPVAGAETDVAPGAIEETPLEALAEQENEAEEPD